MNKPFTVENVQYIDATTKTIEQMVDQLNQRAEQWHSEQSGWVKCSDRLPTKEDADENGWVEFWVQEHGDANMFTKALHYLSPKYAKGITHWRKIVKPEN